MVIMRSPESDVARDGGYRLLSFLQALGGCTNRQVGALQDGLHVVTAHVEIGHGIQPPELYGGYVICLGRFLLGTCQQFFAFSLVQFILCK